MLEKTFGHKKPDVIYQERTGAYGIGFSADDRVPVAMTHLHNGEKGYFLLGGGIEASESHADCIIRESLEEAGLGVVPKELICRGDYYHYVHRMQQDFHGIGYFYYMEIGEILSEPTEPDHHLVWLTLPEIREKLFLPHQVWAVEETYQFLRSRNLR